MAHKHKLLGLLTTVTVQFLALSISFSAYSATQEEKNAAKQLKLAQLAQLKKENERLQEETLLKKEEEKQAEPLSSYSDAQEEKNAKRQMKFAQLAQLKEKNERLQKEKADLDAALPSDKAIRLNMENEILKDMVAQPSFEAMIEVFNEKMRLRNFAISGEDGGASIELIETDDSDNEENLSNLKPENPNLLIKFVPVSETLNNNMKALGAHVRQRLAEKERPIANKDDNDGWEDEPQSTTASYTASAEVSLESEPMASQPKPGDIKKRAALLAEKNPRLFNQSSAITSACASTVTASLPPIVPGTDSTAASSASTSSEITSFTGIPIAPPPPIVPGTGSAAASSASPASGATSSTGVPIAPPPPIVPGTGSTSASSTTPLSGTTSSTGTITTLTSPIVSGTSSPAESSTSPDKTDFESSLSITNSGAQITSKSLEKSTSLEYFLDSKLEDERINHVINESVTAIINDPNKMAETLAIFDNNEIPLKNALIDKAKTANGANVQKEQAYAYLVSQLELTPEKRVESEERLKLAGYPKTEYDFESNRIISQALADRMNYLLIVDTAGSAAGDEEYSKNIVKGVWIGGLYGSNKKTSKNNFGYKGLINGGTLGVDFNISDNENTVVGIAYSNLYSRFKFNYFNNDDKINVLSHVFSLYGQTSLDNLLLQASASIINSKVTRKSLRLVNTDKYETANGKSTSRGYNFETSVGYGFKTENNIMLIPNISLKYGLIRDGEYSETGAGIYNTLIGSKASSELAAIAGIRLNSTKILDNRNSITLGLHTSIENLLSRRRNNNKVKLIWSEKELTNNKASDKVARVGYNIGGSILFKNNKLEVQTSYNCYLKTKYISHQGTLKVRINF